MSVGESAVCSARRSNRAEAFVLGIPVPFHALDRNSVRSEDATRHFFSSPNPSQFYYLSDRRTFCMPTVSEDSHRGAVASVLATDEWMDCHDVAAALSSAWTPDNASSVLSDNHRAGYVHRQEADTPRKDVTYEYKLKERVRVE